LIEKSSLSTKKQNAGKYRQAQEKINIIFLEVSHPEEVMSSLMIIQKLISEDSILANAPGKRAQVPDKENSGSYKTIVMNYLKKLEIDTLKKA